MTLPSIDQSRTSPNRIQSFRYALMGWRTLLTRTPNARIQVVIAMGAMLLGLWLQVSAVEWAIIWFSIGVVLAAESFNTALEAIVDLASPDLNPLARIAKDVSAGGVLFVAAASVLVGLAIFGPPLVVKLGELSGTIR